MGAETELKLHISPADARRVSRLGLLRGIKPTTQQLENVYYDTADHALATQRIALRHRRIGDTWLITVKGSKVSKGGLSTRLEWEYPCKPHVLDFSGIDKKSVRDLLEDLRPQLTPLFATNFRRRAWIFEPHQNLSIEIALDEGEIIARPPGIDSTYPLTRPICELELELKHGDTPALFEIARRLADKLALLPMNESKAQRGQRLFRGIADRPQSALPSALDIKLTPLDAFRDLAHDCLNHFLANADGVRSSDDAEYIHQARVALRRLRALMRLFAPVLPYEFASRYNEGWRYFANQLGDARDFDVLVEETLPSISRHYEGHDAIEAFVKYAHDCRQQAHETARASFHSTELGQLTLSFLNDLTVLPPHDALPELAPLAKKRLKKSLSCIRRNAKDIGQKSIDELHRLRIRFKRLRYGVEFFAPLYPADAIQTYLAELKAIQEILGNINDMERALSVEAKAPEAVRCELISGWLSATQQALIATLPDVTKRFTERRAPWEKNKKHAA